VGHCVADAGSHVPVTQDTMFCIGAALSAFRSTDRLPKGASERMLWAIAEVVTGGLHGACGLG
jgi:hypothetical protein